MPKTPFFPAAPYAVVLIPSHFRPPSFLSSSYFPFEKRFSLEAPFPTFFTYASRTVWSLQYRSLLLCFPLIADVFTPFFPRVSFSWSHIANESPRKGPSIIIPFIFPPLVSPFFCLYFSIFLSGYLHPQHFVKSLRMN